MTILATEREKCNNADAELIARQQARPAKGEFVSSDISPQVDIDACEAAMLEMPQADCPVVHHFGPGVYVRELTLPAGTLAIGHAQRFAHLNIVLSGKVAMIDGDQVKIIQAPAIFTGQPGRKMGYVMETCVWQNIYATDETDIDTLENMFLDKSQSWHDSSDKIAAVMYDKHQADRDDFEKTIAMAGFDADTVRQQSEDETDQIKMPKEWASVFSVRPSAIEGNGLFASWPISCGDMICPARLGGMRTEAGRYTNHAKEPNAKPVMDSHGDIYLVAIRNISGCKGGDFGEEITVNYRQALELSGFKFEEIST